LIRRAGVIEPPKKGDRRLATESILVFSGRWKSDLTIFDQEGDEIGAACKSRDEYELSDAEPLFRVRTTKKSWSGLYFEFSVLGLDSTEIGTIGRQKVKKEMLRERTPGLAEPAAMGWSDAAHKHAALTGSSELGDSRGIKLRRSDGRAIATLRYGSRKDVIRNRLSPLDLMTRLDYALDRSSCRRFYIEDEPGHEAARLTYLRGSSLWANEVGYVLELQPGLSEPLRTLVVATVLLVDNNIIDRSGGGGGGA